MPSNSDDRVLRSVPRPQEVQVLLLEARRRESLLKRLLDLSKRIYEAPGMPNEVKEENHER
jgi:hypothetical protein